MTNRTHTDERKMVQLYYFVSGCVISSYRYVNIYMYQLESFIWSGKKALKKSHSALTFKAGWCDHT